MRKFTYRIQPGIAKELDKIQEHLECKTTSDTLDILIKYYIERSAELEEFRRYRNLLKNNLNDLSSFQNNLIRESERTTRGMKAIKFNFKEPPKTKKI